MDEKITRIVNDLNGKVATPLKALFVDKDELVELMITAAVAKEHMLVVGPPGTAKSEIVRKFAQRIEGRFFEYLLTRFTEPNELFGPVDIKKYQEEGVFERITENMLPEADVVFLDEVFKANSAILNALLTVLNERTFFSGKTKMKIDLVSVYGATNEIPEDEYLAAFYDRFLVRVHTDYVAEQHFSDLFHRGWELEKLRLRGLEEKVYGVMSCADLDACYGALAEVDVEFISVPYKNLIHEVRAEGIRVSDRRAVKMLKLVAASALRRKSLTASPADFWVLRYCWNTLEQIRPLRNLIQPYIDNWLELHPEDASDQIEILQGRPIEVVRDELGGLEKKAEDARSDPARIDLLKNLSMLRREVGELPCDAEERRILWERIERIISKIMTDMDRGRTRPPSGVEASSV